MSEEVTNAITQLKGLLNKYPDKTLEILQYVFGKDTIMKIINRPTYEELEQENKRLKEVVDEVRKYLTSYSSIHTIQFGTEEDSPNDIELNKTLDNKTIIEMTNRHLMVHDKLLQILDKAGNNNE